MSTALKATAAAFPRSTEMRSQAPATLARLRDEQLWAPCKVNAMLPLNDMLLMQRTFSDPDSLEAFVSTALALACDELRAGGKAVAP